jgi:uncharacterized protein (DUF2267 family)
MIGDMTDMNALVKSARSLARVSSDDLGRTWLRSVVSVLSDWGGAPAQRVLEASLPKELVSARLGGRSHGDAVKAHGGDDRVALVAEMGRRANEEDPGKMAQAVVPLLGLVKQQIPPAQMDAFLASYPPAVATEIRAASCEPSWKYGLIPQSYARPVAKAKH